MNFVIFFNAVVRLRFSLLPPSNVNLNIESKICHEWLKTFKDSHIPWMYNCLHAVLAPDKAFYSDSPYVSGFRDVLGINGTPLVENTGIIQFLREYR